MNRDDLRFQKTEENIKRAFMCCVDEKGFDKTRVANICKTAKISRNTFYVHYEDKYELMKAVYDDFEREIAKQFTYSMQKDFFEMNLESSIDWCINAISENKNILKILLKCSKKEFSEITKKIFFDKRFKEMTTNYKQKQNTVEAKLREAYISEAFSGFVEVWLNNYDKISVAEVKKILIDMCYAPVKSFSDNVLK
ncbi:MAG: TetR/AcrR family transcriptional regulator [Oscillospiraceae bacterium]|nr:TetR/AcrR family transcriptional regulator [Oscillospiraceae bacterium]